MFLSYDCNKLGNISIQNTSDNNIFFPSIWVWLHNHHSTLHLYLWLAVVVDYGVECGDAAVVCCWLKCCTKPNIHALLEMLNKIFNSVKSVKLGLRYLKVLKQSFLGQGFAKYWMHCIDIVRPWHRLTFVISRLNFSCSISGSLQIPADNQSQRSPTCWRWAGTRSPPPPWARAAAWASPGRGRGCRGAAPAASTIYH